MNSKTNCHEYECYKYNMCWACVNWLSCKDKKTGRCFECDKVDCKKIHVESVDEVVVDTNEWEVPTISEGENLMDSEIGTIQDMGEMDSIPVIDSK